MPGEAGILEAEAIPHGLPMTGIGSFGDLAETVALLYATIMPSV